MSSKNLPEYLKDKKTVAKNKSTRDATAAFTSDVIFLTNFVKLAEQQKKPLSFYQLSILKIVTKKLWESKRVDILGELFLDLEKTLEKLHKISNIPIETLFFDLSETVTKEPVNNLSKETLELTWATFESLSKTSEEHIRKVLEDYYQTVINEKAI